MDNKKRYLPLIAIVTLVFALLSTFMLYSIYQDTTDDNYLNIFNRLALIHIHIQQYSIFPLY